MACTSCSPASFGICKVCALLDGDETVKKVKFCDFCNVHICESCENDLVRRFNAFKKQKVGALKGTWQSLIEKWKQ